MIVDHSKTDQPAHYADRKVEVIDTIREALGEEGFRSFCRGNVIKYTLRAGRKGGFAEDMRKAANYARWASGEEWRPGSCDVRTSRYLQRSDGEPSAKVVEVTTTAPHVEPVFGQPVTVVPSVQLPGWWEASVEWPVGSGNHIHTTDEAGGPMHLTLHEAVERNEIMTGPVARPGLVDPDEPGPCIACDNGSCTDRASGLCCDCWENECGTGLGLCDACEEWHSERQDTAEHPHVAAIRGETVTVEPWSDGGYGWHAMVDTQRCGGGVTRHNSYANTAADLRQGLINSIRASGVLVPGE